MINENELPYQWPTVEDIAKCLERLKYVLKNNGFQPEEWLDIRLQVREGDYGIGWRLWEGDPQYDWDHRGYWGAGSISLETDCGKLAEQLLDECLEQLAMSE